MGIRKIISLILQVPAWLILIGAFFTGVYAWLNKIQNIKIWTPLILLVVIVCYVFGRWFIKEEEKEDE